jgi:RimJ/RimL family protein N-acetyltransferase
MNPLAIERATLAAWPPAEVSEHQGWLFCAASGVTGRVNAVWPLDWQGESADAAIDAAEAWYAGRGLPPRFKLTDHAFAPKDLEARLDARGYAPKSPTYIMTRALADIPAPNAAIAIEENLSAAFDRALIESTPDPDDLDERRAIALRAPAPKAFAVCGADTPLAIGMSAVAADLAGMFLMRTVPEARRQGHALSVLRALLRWAHESGARHAFLQVDAANEPAVRLYQREGFSVLTTYRFWRKD